LSGRATVPGPWQARRFAPGAVLGSRGRRRRHAIWQRGRGDV